MGELVGNLKETLRLFLKEKIMSKPWVPIGELKKRIEDACFIRKNAPTPTHLTIENLLHVIERLSSEQTVVISDVGAHKVAVARTLQPIHETN